MYRATWGTSSTEVAVKVAPFDSSSSTGSAPVEQQLQELTALDHANVVRTYSGVAFTAQQQKQRVVALSAAAAGHSSSSGGVSSGMPGRALQLEGCPDAAGSRSSSSSARDQQPRQQQPGSSSTGSGVVKIGLLQQQLQQRPVQAAAEEGTEAEMWLMQVCVCVCCCTDCGRRGPHLPAPQTRPAALVGAKRNTSAASRTLAGAACVPSPNAAVVQWPTRPVVSCMPLWPSLV